VVLRAANLIIRVIRLAPIVTCSLALSLGAAEPARAQDASKSTPGATGGAAQAAPAGTPGSGGEATGVDAVCKKAVADLGVGDLSGFKSLPQQTQTALAQSSGAANLFTCLAVAEGKTSYCDPLPKTARDSCVEQSKLLGGLKTIPKESVKAQLIGHLCLSEASKEDCDKVREAIASRKAAICEGLSKPDGAWGRDGLCPALASGDPAKCNTAPQPEQRDACAALATDDPKRCPKGATDCTNMVGNLAALKKQGGEAAEVDPTTAAVWKGKKACAPLAPALESVCSAAEAKKP
jgi:hypothetical protein